MAFKQGDKIEVKVTIVERTVRDINGWMSAEKKYRMQDADGNTYTWTARFAIGLGMQGEQITLRGTVKNVTEVNGKQWVEIIRGRRAK